MSPVTHGCAAVGLGDGLGRSLYGIRGAGAGRLGNLGFTDKAKPEAVEKAREDHAARSAEAERLQAALSRLG